MKTVVKYSNRKLYDKDTSKYVTLLDLLKMPLDGLKVVEHGSGTDITMPTLLSGIAQEGVFDDIRVKVMQHCINELSA